MFDTYQEIFNERGAMYHQAMVDYPQARREEFRAALARLDLRPGLRLADIPSGGCYINPFLPLPVEIISVETSVEFIKRARRWANCLPVLCDDLANLPIETGTVDRCLSLAGSHHLKSKPAFFREVSRVLRAKGQFCLAGVQEGSGVARFLNGFVHEHSRLGHRGEFLDDRTLDELEVAGLRVSQDEVVSYLWHYPSTVDLARGCRLLFGIDQATDAEILDAVTTHLGLEGTSFRWELRFIQTKLS